MSNKLLRLGLSALLMLGVAACGNKNKLNIPPTPPADAMQTELTPEGMVRMAKRLEAAGDLNSAGTFYADAIALNNNLIEAHLGLGRIFTQIGQDNFATTAYGNAFAVDPNNLQALKGYLEGLLPNDGQEEALIALDRYLEANPPTADLYNYQGLAHDLNGDFEKAATALRQGLVLAKPGERMHATILGNLALSLGLSGKTSEAILLLNPFVGDMRRGSEGLSSFRSSIRQNLALVYALSGNAESAVEVAKSALSAEDAEHNRAFYEAVVNLSGLDRVKAVFLGELPVDYQP